MCGRTVQTQGAVFAASTSLESNSNFHGKVVDQIGPRIPPSKGHDASSYQRSDAEATDVAPETDGGYPWHDNFNLSPGHDAVVFTMTNRGELEMSRKIWGLVTKGGTTNSPLPPGPSKHFANLMFNARSDTLFSKPTFSRLLREGKTCLIALDGFFEWKADALATGKGKKKPYFVFRNQDAKAESDCKLSTKMPYLLMAGLWTSVATGYAPPQPATLDTFTILTTEVCASLSWLHSRMPVCVWEEDLAMKWLQQPCQKIHQQMDDGAHTTPETMLQWHAVSSQMSSTKFRSADAIKAIPQPKTVKSFFAPVGTTQQKGHSKPQNYGLRDTSSKDLKKQDTPIKNIDTVVGTKRPSTTTTDIPKKTKKSKANSPVPKKGSISSFFSPKKM